MEVISTASPPEMWLKEIEVGMKKTLYFSLAKVMKEFIRASVKIKEIGNPNMLISEAGTSKSSLC